MGYVANVKRRKEQGIRIHQTLKESSEGRPRKKLLGKGSHRKKMSQKVEKVQKRSEGSAQKFKKSEILNLDFFIRAGGEAIFSFISQM